MRISSVDKTVVKTVIPMKESTLAFVYHVPFWVDDGQVYAEHPALGRYAEALAEHVSRLVVLSPEHGDQNSTKYPVHANNITITNLPAYQNILQFWLQAYRYYYLLWRTASQWDLLTIRMPTHAGFPAFLAAVWHKKPVFLVVVGEWLAYSKLNRYSFLKQWLVDTESRLQEVLMNFMVGHCLTFTNGEDLFRKLDRPGRRVHLMRSSTIRERDVQAPGRDTCQNPPYRILTVGTVSPRKGTSLIPRIIALLEQKNIEVEWLYIGQVDGNSGVQEMHQTLKLAGELDISSRLKFLGPKEWDVLLSYYRTGDLFVLPTYMEGVPRVILEAQAAGLPVVSTNVGGIPTAVTHDVDALLVDPGDANKLAGAIEKVICDKNIRRLLIDNGIESAKRATLDDETRKMIQLVEQQLDYA